MISFFSVCMYHLIVLLDQIEGAGSNFLYVVSYRLQQRWCQISLVYSATEGITD